MQTRLLETLRRSYADDHLLPRPEGVILVAEGIQGKITVATAIPSPIDVIGIVSAVIAIDVKSVSGTRQVVIGQIHDGTAHIQLGLDECSPLCVAVIGIAQVVGLEQQLGILVIFKEFDSPQNIVAIGSAAADGVVHLLGLPDVAHQVGNCTGLYIGIAIGVIVEHVVPVKDRGRQLGQ